MDQGAFRTLGECPFGTVWYVDGEDKIVVNAFQAALYFTVEEFAQFARMIKDADTRLAEGRGRRPATPPAPAPAPAPEAGSKIRQFRPAQRPQDD
ncbi:MAG: hypothetical protein VKO21_00115 [Candidatus Sericytochromatia bacterium]|nr:hypothetical protein [Candidatus Sericytochromatia bacterium]